MQLSPEQKERLALVGRMGMSYFSVADSPLIDGGLFDLSGFLVRQVIITPLGRRYLAYGHAVLPWVGEPI